MKLRYFAWVREKVGLETENVDLPSNVVCVADLIAWLQSRGDGYADAFAEPETIRVALDQTHAEHDTPIGTPDEIALFPPMTGG